MTTMNTREKSIHLAINDHGYMVRGVLIIQKGIRGFTSDRVIGRCRDVFDAAEQLIPIIRERDFSDRVQQIRK